MANNHGCINNSLDDVDYSSPVPVIGLYIAGASVACLVMMLLDIAFGIYARKRWLPCKVFKLDSVTLTLLGVVAKLPVDLTTSMPGRHDQLSKLTGTVIICISMGFLVPSLGASNESECQTNMVALSIFVITVAANICIQLRTGVIVLFFEEHIIILCLMLLLLMLLWHISLNIKISKRLAADHYKDLLAKENSSSMFGRLKLCYLYSYCSNPQFIMCKDPMYASISIVCLLCFFTLMQATLRSVILRKVDFCSGAEDSDYGWSMPYVTITQNVTVIVGTIAIVFRWLALFSRMEFDNLIVSFCGDNDAARRNQTLGWWNRWQNKFVSLYMRTASAIQLLIVSPSWLLRKLFGLYKRDKLNFFDDLPHQGLITASEYIVQKSISDIIKFRDDCKSKSITNLLQHLPRTPPQPRGNGYPEYLEKEGPMKVCSLSVALLVKVAQVSVPDHHLGSLLCAYKEAYEIIHFIDKTLQTKKSEDNDKLSYAKAVWTAGDFSCLLSDVVTDNQSVLNRAVAIIAHLQKKMESDKVFSELKIMVDFINLQSFSSTEELCDSMKQMFLDMLRALFSQLPIAIHKSLRECQAEEFEESVRLAMKFLFLIQPTEPLELDINWSWPPGIDIASFIIEDDDPTTPKPTGSLERLKELRLTGGDLELAEGVNRV